MAEKTERVEMVKGVVGTNGKDWLPGTTHTAPASFARQLYERGKAKPAGQGGKAEKGGRGGKDGE